MIAAGKLQRAGLVATNSIRGGANREVLKHREVLKPIVEHGRIFEAWSDEGWTVDGAAVRVSLVCFGDKASSQASLDGQMVNAIFADLSAERGGTDLTAAARLSPNLGVAYQGPVKVGPFDIEAVLARQWLTSPNNPNGKPNSEVVRPLLNGMDITRRSSKSLIRN